VTFTLLPAVDVANGQAVRLVRAEAGTETTYGAPRDAALAWQRDGAEWIHLVDLDAAFGRGSNAELLAGVVGELDVRVQLSGGITDDASLDRALATGCDRVNLSTAALGDPEWVARVVAAHGERVAVGLDVRIVNGAHLLSARGGAGDGGDLWTTLARLERDGAPRYVVTDVSKDGTLRGPNVELLREVAKATAAPIVASGGIAQVADLVTLAQAAADGSNVEGAIVGKALYAGRFTLPEALAAVREAVTTSRTAG
jgi:phosphoribosyl isomerase A